MPSNPFQPIYDECNKGDSQAKFADLPEFPRLIDIELTNLCNFRCLMCPTGTFSQKRAKGFMTEQVFRKIVEEIAPRGTALRFIRFGEPTMHPQFFQFLEIAKEHGILCHVNTNGSLISDELIHQLCDLPLDSIKFSFQGIDKKSYSEMRNTDFFDDLVKLITNFNNIRGNRDKPYLHVSTSITYETTEQIQTFKALTEPLVDKVSVGYTVMDHLDVDSVRLRPEELKTMKWLKEQQSLVKEHPQCPEVYDKLSINWDGSVSACCTDSDNIMLVGDIVDHSVHDVWNSNILNRYREILARHGHAELPLCRTCYNYAGLYKAVPTPEIVPDDTL